ncbi:hypothetical protein chiPu_0030777, partial [Chiloscyllium punctatum]|nr:hypothetical protein [Chiloscyllium punctatum]
ALGRASRRDRPPRRSGGVPAGLLGRLAAAAGQRHSGNGGRADCDRLSAGGRPAAHDRDGGGAALPARARMDALGIVRSGDELVGVVTFDVGRCRFPPPGVDIARGHDHYLAGRRGKQRREWGEQMRCITLAAIAAFSLVSTSAVLAADKKYDPGASDTEIKIGQTMPYSGPASAYGTQGRAEAAFWKMINSQGGINGRKITLLSMDDGYSPPKTVEQTRKLVEQDEILADIGSLG